MSEKEKAQAQKIIEAFETLPDSKREYLVGFAEGVHAARSTEQGETNTDKRKEEST